MLVRLHLNGSFSFAESSAKPDTAVTEDGPPTSGESAAQEETSKPATEQGTEDGEQSSEGTGQADKESTPAENEAQ